MTAACSKRCRHGCGARRRARRLSRAARDRACCPHTSDEPDQWTIETAVRTTGPLHVISLGDSESTDVYVAANTGEIAMKTDRTSRFWGYAGPVMHWFYFRPLRVRGPLWANLIVYGSLVGCVLCVLGLVIGLYRYSCVAALSPRLVCRRRTWDGCGGITTPA